MYGLNPLAVRASIQLGYAKPTAGQAKRSQSPRGRGRYSTERGMNITRPSAMSQSPRARDIAQAILH